MGFELMKSGESIRTVIVLLWFYLPGLAVPRRRRV